ncbi:PAS domain S-box protein [Geoglobus sp.]
MNVIVISKRHPETIVDAARESGVGKVIYFEELKPGGEIESLLDGSVVVVDEHAIASLGDEFFEKLQSVDCPVVLVCESELMLERERRSTLSAIVPAEKERIVSAILSAASTLSSSTQKRYAGLNSGNVVRALFDSRSVGVVFLDDQEITEVNDRFLSIVGKSREQVVGRRILHVFSEEDREIVENVLATGGVVDALRVASPGGQKNVILEVINLDAGGRKRLCLFVDVTDHHLELEMERKLKEAYKTVYELSPYPIVVHEQGRILMYNRKAKEFFRRSEDMLGMNLTDFMTDESKNRFLRKMESLMLGFDTCPLEEIRFVIGGDLKETIVNCKAIEISGRNLVISVIVDLTEGVRVARLLRIINKINTSLVEVRNRKIVLQIALKELEREYDSAFAVIMLDGKFEVIRAGRIEVTDSIENECVRKAMELQEEVLVKQGEHPDYCVYRGVHGEHESAVFPLKIGDDLFGFLTILAKRVFMDSEIKLLRTLVGTLAYVYHRSELEEIRARTMEQLRHNIREFSHIVDRIKNPLAVIYGYCELADEFTDAELLAVKIKEEVERITRLIKQLERDWQTSEDLLELIENMRK